VTQRVDGAATGAAAVEVEVSIVELQPEQGFEERPPGAPCLGVAEEASPQFRVIHRLQDVQSRPLSGPPDGLFGIAPFAPPRLLTAHPRRGQPRYRRAVERFSEVAQPVPAVSSQPIRGRVTEVDAVPLAPDRSGDTLVARWPPS